ncbi:hypothetical protein BCR34DRAFT_603581 [Clohesyomyces aquaticus]|uniref:Rhodopsin domain-containing protein n=1 Tax=Clohesyomyces aquaticus TaxID=1231657 RepID=A0A1Y1ZDG5_9PLEO|nr:hypothetical protein BCR34DRAFT_603581 [Clohesyomyces aquaticus]
MFAPHDLGPTAEYTAYALTGLSTIVVGVRFYCRIWVVGKLKPYDYIMLSALVCTWGMCIINHYQLLFGSGKTLPHGNTPPPSIHRIIEMAFGAARSWYAFQLMYLVDLALIKFSILAFYLSIATSRTFRLLVHLTAAAVLVFTIVMIFVNAFECPKHPSYALGPEIFQREKYGCLEMTNIYYIQAGFNIFSDAAILFLPMPLLIKIKSMPRLKRYALIAVFSVGALAPIASVIRVWGVYMWATSTDPRYYGAYVMFWTQVELNTAIISASVPSLQPLFKKLFGEFSRYTRRNAYYYYGHGTVRLSNVTEVNTGRGRGNVSEIPLTGLESPRSSYRHPSRIQSNEFGNEAILIQDLGEEEEIQNRVRYFASQRSSVHSHIPKSPQYPRDALMSSG